MADCSKIASDVLKNCDNLVNGIKDTVYFINLDDIDKDACTINTGNKLIIEGIVLKTASPSLRAYKLEGRNFSNDHDVALIKGQYMNGFDHNLMFRIFNNDPETKAWVNDIASGARFVAIIENNYNNSTKVGTPGDSVFEVLGWDLGLEISEATRNTTDADVKGGWILKATCDDTNKEPYPPRTFYKTDLATTRGLVEALV